MRRSRKYVGNRSRRRRGSIARSHFRRRSKRGSTGQPVAFRRVRIGPRRVRPGTVHHRGRVQTSHERGWRGRLAVDLRSGYHRAETTRANSNGSRAGSRRSSSTPRTSSPCSTPTADPLREPIDTAPHGIRPGGSSRRERRRLRPSRRSRVRHRDLLRDDRADRHGNGSRRVSVQARRRIVGLARIGRQLPNGHCHRRVRGHVPRPHRPQGARAGTTTAERPARRVRKRRQPRSQEPVERRRGAPGARGPGV